MRGADIVAVTFDFYNTLVEHRTGAGRGRMLMEYFEREGLECDPWHHQVLYDVFEPHGREYSPGWPPDRKKQYRVRFVHRLFERLRVQAPGNTIADHAESVWELAGPTSLHVFGEVRPVLETLRHARLRTAVVSNWQCGLGHFCVELGIGDLFDHVVASAEFGAAKPDRTIFEEACRRLGTRPEQTLHVGDTVADDLDGARNAGLHALLVRRRQDPRKPDDSITDLIGVLDVLGLEPVGS